MSLRQSPGAADNKVASVRTEFSQPTTINIGDASFLFQIETVANEVVSRRIILTFAATGILLNGKQECIGGSYGPIQWTNGGKIVDESLMVNKPSVLADTAIRLLDANEHAALLAEDVRIGLQALLNSAK